MLLKALDIEALIFVACEIKTDPQYEGNCFNYSML